MKFFLVLLVTCFTFVLSRPVCCSNCGVNVFEVAETQNMNPCKDKFVCETKCSDVIDNCPSHQTLYLDLTPRIKIDAAFRELWNNACVLRWGVHDNVDTPLYQFYYKLMEKYTGYTIEQYKKDNARFSSGMGGYNYNAKQFVFKVDKNIKRYEVIEGVARFLDGLNNFEKLCHDNNWKSKIYQKLSELKITSKTAAQKTPLVRFCEYGAGDQMMKAYECLRKWENEKNVKNINDFHHLTKIIETEFLKLQEKDTVNYCKCLGFSRHFYSKRNAHFCPTCFTNELNQIESQFDLVGNCRRLCKSPNAKSIIAPPPTTQVGRVGDGPIVTPKPVQVTLPKPTVISPNKFTIIGRVGDGPVVQPKPVEQRRDEEEDQRENEEDDNQDQNDENTLEE